MSIALAVLMPHPPVLVPAVGKERIADIRASLDAMREASRAVVESQPETVVLISPHSPRHPLAFGVWTCAELRGSLAAFGAPEEGVALPVDGDFIQALAKTGVSLHGIAGGALDHGALVPLWFLAEAGWRGRTVVLALNSPGAGGLHNLGRGIAAAARALGRRIAIVASGDMSHRLIPGAPAGFEPTAKDFDATFVDRVRRGALRDVETINPALQSRAAEDVVDSTAVALAATDWDGAGHRVLSYEGPFGVGYTVAVLYDASQARSAVVDGADLVRVARRAVESAFADAKAQPPAPEGDYVRQASGVFVTIKTGRGKLRGCVGTMERAQFPNIVAETWANARSAAFGDRRFTAITAPELHNLRFEVSVLHSFAPTTREALEPRRFGVIVQAPDGRRATLLPALDGIDTAEEQFRIVCEKGGIRIDEAVTLTRYEVDKFSEPTAGA